MSILFVWRGARHELSHFHTSSRYSWGLALQYQDVRIHKWHSIHFPARGLTKPERWSCHMLSFRKTLQKISRKKPISRSLIIKKLWNKLIASCCNWEDGMKVEKTNFCIWFSQNPKHTPEMSLSSRWGCFISRPLKYEYEYESSNCAFEFSISVISIHWSFPRVNTTL